MSTDPDKSSQSFPKIEFNRRLITNMASRSPLSMRSLDRHRTRARNLLRQSLHSPSSAGQYFHLRPFIQLVFLLLTHQPTFEAQIMARRHPKPYAKYHHGNTRVSTQRLPRNPRDQRRSHLARGPRIERDVHGATRLGHLCAERNLGCLRYMRWVR